MSNFWEAVSADGEAGKSVPAVLKWWVNQEGYTPDLILILMKIASIKSKRSLRLPS